jgi:hypothetical protein
MVGVVVDRVHAWVGSRWPERWSIGALAGSVLAVVTLVPTVVVLWPNLPLTVQAVVLPRWYTEVGAHLPAGQVVLSYPAPFSGVQSSQAWQAVNRMAYAQAGGGGPEGQPGRAGQARAGFEVLFGASLALGPPPQPSAANLAAIRRALDLWGVTIIVIPDQPGLPAYDQGRGPAYAVGLLTAAMGRPPAYEHAAWVWASVNSGSAPVAITATAFDACTTGALAAAPSRTAVASCILESRGAG